MTLPIGTPLLIFQKTVKKGYNLIKVAGRKHFNWQKKTIKLSFWTYTPRGAALARS